MKKTRLALLLAAFATVALGFVGCQPEVEHVHTFADAWTFDESSHWHEATCGHDEKSNLGTHNFSEWKTVVEPTEYKDGSKERTCSTCKYVDKEIILALGHHHNLKSEWSSDKTSHWHAYDCGRPEHFEDKAAHKFIYKDNGWQKCEICDKENTTPVSLDTLGTYDSTKMTFGVYPQTVKADTVTVDKTVKNTEITRADYYLGSDGAWYAECTENAYNTGYKYSDGNTVAQKSANSVKYFKVEPIEWVYLAETKCLHAKKILTANVQWYASSNNYKNSNIRSWLNGTFLNRAFTENQKGKIKTTTVDNSVVSTGYSSNRYACEDTSEKVFLLSYKEATASGNGFTAYDVYGAGNSRIRLPTDYALANFCGKDSDSSDGGLWWLRSPYSLLSSRARVVNYDGSASSDRSVDSKYGGVVPALSISEYE